MAQSLQGLFSMFGTPLSGGSGGTAGNLPALHAAGGTVASGGWGIVGERGWELVRANPGGGVSIFSNAASTAMLGHLPGFASGGMLMPSIASPSLAPHMTVNIVNNAGADVSATQRPNSSGGTDLLVMIDRRQDGRIAKGDANNAFSAKYGLKPQLTKR